MKTVIAAIENLGFVFAIYMVVFCVTAGCESAAQRQAELDAKRAAEVQDMLEYRERRRAEPDSAYEVGMWNAREGMEFKPEIYDHKLDREDYILGYRKVSEEAVDNSDS